MSEDLVASEGESCGEESGRGDVRGDVVAFGQTPKYWLNLQATHDLSRTKPARPIGRMPEAIKTVG